MPMRNHMRQIRQIVQVGGIPASHRLLQLRADLPKFPCQLLGGMTTADKNARQALEKLARVADAAFGCAYTGSSRLARHICARDFARQTHRRPALDPRSRSTLSCRRFRRHGPWDAILQSLLV